MAKIRVEGLDKLQKALEKNATLDRVKHVVHFYGGQLKKGIVKNADFKGHKEWRAGFGMVDVKASGTTKRSVDLKFSDDGMTAESGPTTEYAPYVNWGTRFMEPQPFVSDAYHEQAPKFKKALQKLVK